MTTIACSRPECQTTAGCKCLDREVSLFGYPRVIEKREAEITALRAQVEELRRERDEAQAEAKRWSDNWNANVAEMSEKFRAVNIERVIEATGQDIFALSARAAAAEAETAEQARLLGMSAERELAMRAEVERLRAAAFQLVTSAKEIDQGNGALNCVVAPYLVRDLRAALSEKSDG